MSSPGHRSFDTGHADLVHDVAFDFYGKRVATCSSDRLIKVYEASEGGETDAASAVTIKGHEGPVFQVAWAHPQFGTLLASCGYDRRVLVFREAAPGSWVQVYCFEGHLSSANSISWAPPEAGLHLACASSDGSVTVHSHQEGADTWEVQALRDCCPSGVMSVSWATCQAADRAADGTLASLHLAAAGCDGDARVYHLRRSATGWQQPAAAPQKLHYPGAPAAGVAWLRDVAWCPSALGDAAGGAGLVLAAGGDDGRVTLWSPPEGGAGEWSYKQLPQFPSPVWRLSWNTTGSLLAVSCGDNTVTLWKEELDGQWVQVSNVPLDRS